MKAERVKNAGEHRKLRRRYLRVGWKSVWKGTKGNKTPPVPEKKRVRTGKDLQTCGEGRKSRKGPTLVVGKKPNGKYQIEKTT
jgi:hypothetical protein